MDDEFNYEKDKIESLNPMYWDKFAKKYVNWDKMYDEVYSGNERYPNWFNGGKLNLCNNLLDIHMNDQVQRNRIAFIHECPLLGITNKITYFKLWEKVCTFSRALKILGIKKGVIIYMPNHIENAIAILSCTRIGAIFSCVFEGFSGVNLALRIDIFKPKLIITSSFVANGKEIIKITPTVKKALELSNHKIDNIIIDERLNNISHVVNNNIDDVIPKSLSWDDLMKDNCSNPLYEYEPVESNHGVALNFTSGTTGTPKGYQQLLGF